MRSSGVTARSPQCDHPNGHELGRSQLERAGRTADKVGANGRQDGVGKTSSLRWATEPAIAIWIRSHEHHTGPRPEMCRTKRPHIRPYLT